MTFFTELENKISQNPMEPQRNLGSHSDSLGKKNVRRITIQDFNLYYEVIVIKQQQHGTDTKTDMYIKGSKYKSQT